MLSNNIIYKILLFAGLVFILDKTYAQTIKGIVKNAQTKVALPFVNIGIVVKNKGTVTNDAGMFSLNLDNYKTDSLKVSMVGFQSQTFAVAKLVNSTDDLNIALIPSDTQLSEIKVTNRKWKTAVLGNTTTSQSTTAGFMSNTLGHEIGAIIKIKRSPSWLKRFNATVVENSITDSIKLRLNMYSVKDGLPYQNILQKNIYLTLHKGQKDISIDLEPYGIVVEDKFFVSLEWIQSKVRNELMFSASLFSSPIISRETSQAKWEKIGAFGVGFNVLAEY